MITLKNLATFKKTIAHADVKEILYFSQGGITNVISFVMKTDLQSLIDLIVVLDTTEFGQTFYNHKRESRIIGISCAPDGSCELNLYLSEEYELYTQVQNIISHFNKNSTSEETNDVKAENI